MYTKGYVRKFLPKRPENSHKGTFGHVLNIAGSEFYPGAAYFSSVSALKVGCGLATLASVDTVLKSISAICPDIILMPLGQLNKETLEKFQAVSIGCGFSKGVNAINTFKKTINILAKSTLPVVIDADGLNILSIVKNTQLPKNTILTPHPKEMARLLDVNVENVLSHPEYWAKKCSEKYNCTTILKIHNSVVADNQDNFYENDTGNSALSHGGSGDVLCGMIAGYLAQGLNCFEASCLAVYLHGMSAEIASKELTEYSVLASDLINYIPKAIKTLI